jgi:hypothetical protein
VVDKELLTYEAARYAYGTMNTREMQQLVNKLIDEGIFEDVFLDVIWPEVDTRERVGAAFVRAMRCIGVNIPDYEKAVWDILRYHNLRIARAEVDPLEGTISMINGTYWHYDFHAKTKKYLGDSHGIEKFIGIYWGYDDLLAEPETISYKGKYGDEAIEELKTLALSESRKWLEKYQARFTG